MIQRMVQKITNFKVLKGKFLFISKILYVINIYKSIIYLSPYSYALFKSASEL